MSDLSKKFNPQLKILYHLETVLDFFSGKNVDPITLEIDPSNACNHSCPFCISGHIHLKKFKGTKFFNREIMSKELLMKLVKELSLSNVKAIAFTGGGEPTMNPHLKEAINYLKQNSKIDLGMYSNGTNFKKFDLFETIASSLRWIRISVDAGQSKTYDELRVTNKQNNFEIVLENIKELVRVKKKIKSDITIGVGFVVSKDNVDEIIDFAKVFKDIDVDYCQYKPEIIQIERNGDKDNQKEQIAAEFWAYKVVALLQEAKEILGKKFESNNYKVEDLINDQEKYGRGYKECLGSQLQPCISSDGHFYVCTNHRGHKEYSYGNIKEKSFQEIWSDVENRKKIMNQICNVEKFSKCTQLCKPHESNKILFTIKNNIDNKEMIENLKKQSKNIKKSIIHKNFI